MLIRVSHTKKVALPGPGNSESFTTTIEKEIDAPAHKGGEFANALFEQAVAAVEEQIDGRGPCELPAETASCCESCGKVEVVVEYADDENIEGEPYIDRNGEPYQKCRSRCGRRFLVFTHNEGVYPVRPGDRVRLKRSGRYWNVVEKTCL
ncbi:MAG: hypothetical protein ABIH66_02190 [bacterium]